VRFVLSLTLLISRIMAMRGALMNKMAFRIASNENNSGDSAEIIRLNLKTMFVKKFVSEQWILGRSLSNAR